ncbi:hypothetical protein PInf_023283 [Phytophthora infestans]|nr:hypothetical protein PInf_023283 [Phytophthora infestans]
MSSGNANAEPNGIDTGSSKVASVNAVARAQTKKILTAPYSTVSPFAAWTSRNLIGPGAASSALAPASYTLKQAARPIDYAAGSYNGKRSPALLDALQDAVDK